jgi:hypothetical protein
MVVEFCGSELKEVLYLKGGTDMVKITNDHQERFVKQILGKFERKYKCSECLTNYLTVKNIEFKHNDMVAEVTLGCCESRFKENAYYDDFL